MALSILLLLHRAGAPLCIMRCKDCLSILLLLHTIKEYEGIVRRLKAFNSIVITW